MSLIKVLPEYLEKFTLTLHPEVRYVSSSIQGTGLATGSMPVSARPSKNFKNIVDPSQLGENSYDINSPGVPGFNSNDYAILDDLESAKRTVKTAHIERTSADISQTMEKYVELVNSASQVARNTKRFDIVRFDPPFTFTMNSSIKNCVRNVLMPFYASYLDGCQFSYTNYHTLNFFTGSNVPPDSAIIYNNFKFPDRPRPYSPTGSFSIDFYINPRYSNDTGGQFKAGTIMHVSSTFAVSLVSGTLRDSNNLVDGYRILLQLSHSADVAPSKVNLSKENNSRSYPNDLIFLSDDNSLRKNNWHHVCIRWGGKSIDAGTGSIIIDGSDAFLLKNESKFSIPSSSILPPPHVQCSALILGNYFNGFADEARFFNETAGINEGVYPTEAGLPVDPNPLNYALDHPLNAEIHDIKVYDKRISDNELRSNLKYGQSSTDAIMFYVPPYFVKSSRTRDSLITPFQTERKAPEDPFNVVFSFGVGGFMINLPNFLREFKNGFYPRLYNLTASTIDTTVLDITANQYAYATASIRKRNLTILPNDNGKFFPDFKLLNSGTLRTGMSQFKHPLGGVDNSIISLNDMIPSSSAFLGLPTVTARDLDMIREMLSLPDDTSPESIASQVAGITPENMAIAGGKRGPILTIYQRTRDPSSNEICIFDMSNLFYGDRILPKSFYLTDPNVSGSGGKVGITLRDNGRGSLYRADCLTTQAEWPNVGTILNNEGVVIVKSPHLSYFGKDKFEAAFKGEQNVHILTVNLPAGVGIINSSSNPQYKILSASNNANDLDSRFVYIAGLNLHDDNLNVIMRANLAQPVLKREEDEVVVRFKIDF